MFILKLSIFKYTKNFSCKNKADKRVIDLASITNKLNLPKYNHLLCLIKSIRTTQNFDNALTTGKRKINDKTVDAKSVT